MLVNYYIATGAKKVNVTACHSGKLKLAFTCPDVISTSPKKAFWLTESVSQFFWDSNSSKNITCWSGNLKTEFTSLIAKSASPGLSETTFFASCSIDLKTAKWKRYKKISHKRDSLQILLFHSSKYQIKFFHDPHNPLGTIFLSLYKTKKIITVEPC